MKVEFKADEERRTGVEALLFLTLGCDGGESTVDDNLRSGGSVFMEKEAWIYLCSERTM